VTRPGRDIPVPYPETRGSQIEDPEAVLALWQDRLKSLLHEVKEWVERGGWRTRTIEKPIDDRKLVRKTAVECQSCGHLGFFR
jgi:hypothetical protein